MEQDVVEGERDRGGEDDQRPLRVRERELAARAEEDDHRHAGEGDRETREPPDRGALQPEGGRYDEGQRGASATTSAAVPDVVKRVPALSGTW